MTEQLSFIFGQLSVFLAMDISLGCTILAIYLNGDYK